MEVDVEDSLVDLSSDLHFLGLTIGIHGISLLCKQHLGSKVVTLIILLTIVSSQSDSRQQGDCATGFVW